MHSSTLEIPRWSKDSPSLPKSLKMAPKLTPNRWQIAKAKSIHANWYEEASYYTNKNLARSTDCHCFSNGCSRSPSCCFTLHFITESQTASHCFDTCAEQPSPTQILENAILERMSEPLLSQGGPKIIQRWPKASKLNENGTHTRCFLCLLHDFLCILPSTTKHIWGHITSQH